MTVGKPNNVDVGIVEYYSNILISDLLIWRTRLNDDEVLHSYRISREYYLSEWFYFRKLCFPQTVKDEMRKYHTRKGEKKHERRGKKEREGDTHRS